MYDCHIHTRFSTDSKTSIDEAVKKAEEKNLGIIITEHMDLKYPDSSKYIFNIEEYLKSYSNYRCEKLLLGMEMGMRLDCALENIDLQKNYDFDYIIGSVHVVNGIDIYEEQFYENREKKEAYEEYFKYILDCIKIYDFVDSLGHIDYIARYAWAEDKEIYYAEYSDYFDEIFKAVINNNQAIELNTRRFSDRKSIDNLITIYKRFSELGGKYVVFGSDAHNPANIGAYFRDAERVAEICGLKIAYYKERQMKMSK